METFVYAFLFCGFVCMVSQIILDNTKLTPGHVTSLFVVIGAFLDLAGIYDKISQTPACTDELSDNHTNKGQSDVYFGITDDCRNIGRKHYFKKSVFACAA